MDTPAAIAATPGRYGRPGANLSLWQRLSFDVLHGVLAALLAVTSLRGLYRLARTFGTLEWLLNYRRRRRFGRALRAILGRAPTSRERRSTTRAYFMQSRCDKLIYLIFDCIPAETAATLLTIQGRELLDGSLARGNGVYLAMSHQGAHHVVAMLMAQAGYRTAGVRDPQEGAARRYVQDRFDRVRPDFPRMHVVYSDAYARDIYRCFQQGYLLGSAVDVSRVRGANQRHEEVTIFGESRRFLTGPFRIAIRCRAPILQAFVIPEANFRYRLEIIEMLIDPDDVTDESCAISDAVGRYARNVERYVRQTPSLVSRV